MLLIIAISILYLSIEIKTDDYPLFKAKLRVNGIDMAGFYKMVPGQGMRYYSLDKKLIDEVENRISVIEGLSSTTENKI
jgi:hypothetical protein